MVDVDNDRSLGNAPTDRLTEPGGNQPAESMPQAQQDRRLDNREALILLFTVAMLPSYVIPAPLDLIK